MIIKKLDIEVLLLGLWLREGLPPKKMYKCDLRPFRGGFSKPYPLIVKYIHKENIHDFLEKQLLKKSQ